MRGREGRRGGRERREEGNGGEAEGEGGGKEGERGGVGGEMKEREAKGGKERGEALLITRRDFLSVFTSDSNLPRSGPTQWCGWNTFQSTVFIGSNKRRKNNMKIRGQNIGATWEEGGTQDINEDTREDAASGWM